MISEPIPAQMRHLKLDARGYPIPFGVLIDREGKPHFAINTEHMRALTIKRDLCSICGKVLLRGRWFVGGPLSAFHPRGAYIDMPMHDACVHYALKVCPYLTVRNWSHEIGPHKYQNSPGAEGMVAMIDPTMIPERPPVFVAVMAVGQHMQASNTFQDHVVPARPYRKVEFWQHGQQLNDNDGYAICAQTMNCDPRVVRAFALSAKAVA